MSDASSNEETESHQKVPTSANAPAKTDKDAEASDRPRAVAKVFDWLATNKVRLAALSTCIGLFVLLMTAEWWFAYYLCEGKLNLQATISEGKKNDLKKEIADLKRKLSEKQNENEPTIETAKPANRSYLDFLGDLKKARSQGALGESRFVDQYGGRKVQWDCTILKKISADECYVIAPSQNSEAKDQALAQFRSGEFDLFANEGDRKTIEGVFRKTATNGIGIILYDCRFASESKEP